MKFIKEWAGVVAVVILVITNVLPLFGGQNLGASGTRFPNGLSADSTSPTSGQVRGTTFTSTSLATFASAVVTGSFTQSTSNSATTTAAVGCIQTTATSTATPVFLTFTPHVGTTTTSGVVSDFLVSARYGTCPH